METKLISFWSARDFIVLLATVASGSALCLAGRGLRPRMALLPIFGAYEAVINVLLFCVALRPVPNHAYFVAYWWVTLGENIFQCLIAVELIGALIPGRQLFLAWSGGLATLLLLDVGRALPASNEASLLNATLAADFVAAAILAALLWVRSDQTPHHFRFIIAGVLVPASVHAMGAVDWLNRGLSPMVQGLLPMASLAGLIFLLIGSLHDASDTRKKICWKRYGLVRNRSGDLQVSLVKPL